MGEIFRQRKNSNPQQENPFDKLSEVQNAAAKELEAFGESASPPPFGQPDSPINITGNIPPQFQQMLQNKGIPFQQGKQQPPQGMQGFAKPQQRTPQPDLSSQQFANTGELEDVLAKIHKFTHQWEPINLPSKGKFYNGDIGGIIHVRPMTGGEEQILATQRHVKKGIAMDMIFEKCIKEPIDTKQLLVLDRNYLLIFLRGISYTPEYDVEIKCPECPVKFTTVIDLASLDVFACPDNYSADNLSDVLPTTQINFKYRLSNGYDELEVNRYKENNIKMWGDQRDDDTLLYKIALLIEHIDGITNTMEIQTVLKQLPVNDVNYLRNTVNDPPFGVNTKVPMICPSCTHEFEIELPLESSFFFPRKKKEKTHQ